MRKKSDDVGLVLGNNEFDVILIVSLLLSNDLSEVERVLPEDGHYNKFEEESDVADELNEAAKFVFMTSILEVLIVGRWLNDEKPDEIIHPGEE